MADQRQSSGFVPPSFGIESNVPTERGIDFARSTGNAKRSLRRGASNLRGASVAWTRRAGKALSCAGVASCAVMLVAVSEGARTAYAATTACVPNTACIPATTGETVAILELAAPTSSEFILRGTIPVPRNTYPRADGLIPFSVRDSDGTLIPAQVERVTWHADQAQGADVVEVLARVHRPNVAPGTRIQYEIVDAPHPRKRPSLNARVRALLTTPNGIRITTDDVFGNRYKVDIREGLGSRQVLRLGSEVLTMRYYGMLTPLPGSDANALPHMMGVHSYISYWALEDVITIDLRIHNGACNVDKTDPIDDCQKQLYFSSVDVLVPDDWVGLQDFDDPTLGGMRPGSNCEVFQLVKSSSTGDAHVMPVRGQMERRIAITPVGNEARAREFLDQRFLGFCRPGTNAQGTPLWSWWNPSTPNYYPQRHRLPELAHLGEVNIRGRYNFELSHINDAITTGVSFNSYPIHSPSLGWAHPWGVKYGGMTGGTEINLYDGFLLAYGASREGYRLFELRHRMYSDRMPNCYYKKNGDPTSIFDWIQHGTSFDWIPSAFYNGVVGSFDMFGFNQATNAHVAYAQANNLTPAYETDLFEHEAIDLQHAIRYLNNPKVLVWLGNDAMSKDDIRMQAEVSRLSYHHMPTSSNGQAVVTGMLSDINFVNLHPGKGFEYGRDNGWQNDAMLAAYSFGTPAWRSAARNWFDRQVDMLMTGQIPCTGMIQSVDSSQLLNGEHRARQSIEQAIVENSLWGMRQCVYRGVDPVRTLQVENILRESTYAMISYPAWSSQLKGPWAVVATGPTNISLPVYCAATFPVDNTTDNGADKYQTWSSFAYGFELTGDPTFLQRAFEMAGSQNDLLWELQNDMWQYLENRAALFSLVYSNNYP